MPKSKIVHLVLITFILFFNSLCKNKEQSEVETIDPYLLMRNADTARLEKKYELSIELNTKALPILRYEKNDMINWLVCNRRNAQLLSTNLSKRIEALSLISDARDSLLTWRAPANTDEYHELTLLYLREARIFLIIGDLLQLKESFERVELIFRDHLDDGSERSHRTAKYLYTEMGNTYTRLGEFKNAKDYFEKSLAYESKYNQDNITSFNDYGSAYLSQDSIQKALNIFNVGLSRDFVNTYIESMLWLNTSESFARLNRLKDAEKANETASIQMKEKAHFADTLQYERCQRGYLENKAIIAEKKNQWSEAAGYYRAAIAEKFSHSMQGREKAGFIAAEATAWFQLGQFDTALTRYHEAYLQFYPALQEKTTDLPNPADLLTDKILADVLEGKALCFTQMNQFDLALAMYERIPVVEAQLRATHTFESSSLFALKKSRKRFDDAVELAWKAWQNSHDDKYAEQAFRFTEMARGVLQTKGLKANDAYSTLDNSQKTKDKSFSTRIAAAETELAEIENNSDPRVNGIMQSIRDLKRAQKEFRASVMKTNPAYAAEMSNESICPMDGVHHLLRKGQVMFDYYLVDSLALHIFMADKQGNVSWHRTAWTDAQQQALNSFILYIGKRDEDNNFSYFNPTAFFLYQSLLAPALNGGKAIAGGICLGKNYPKVDTALLIVPDMALAGLSFEALLTDTLTGASNWRNLAYVVKKYSTGYAYSASLLQLQQNITRKHAGSTFIPFAGFAPEYTILPNLDNAVADVKYGQKNFGGKAYTDTTASEEQFRKIAEDAQILLFSMHGVSNHLEPSLSKLYFGDSLSNESNTNNVLTAGELQNIPCRADLAIMSACETGDGPVEKGEGVYSLARAFTISGVPSTAMSLWLLPGISSSNMVQDFLTGIKERKQKDVALRTAKLNWLQDGASDRYAHPYYWACFVTAGDTSPLTIASNIYCVYLILALGLIIVFLGLRKYEV